MLRTLLQPRYAALSVLVVVVAALCVALGTWQISRLEGKISANDALRANAHAPTVPVSTMLTLVGTSSRVPSANAIEYRTVTAVGSYDAAHQSLVRQRTVNGDTGYLVLTPFDTGGGTLLVVRGFISGSTGNGSTPPLPAPPAGRLTITARLRPAETRNDAAAQLPGRQVESINPREQAVRLGQPVFDGYGELLAAQPGVGSLYPIPSPDLSNPAGGAVEPQHFAYIVQWYLFAALALAAPFAMVRAEAKHAREHELDEAPTIPDNRSPQSVDELRAAKLADRYGRAFR